MDNKENAIVIMAEKILEEKFEENCYDDFMSFGWYDNPQITNLINLNGLSELIFSIKRDCEKRNEDIIYIHDHIEEFEETFKKELLECDIEMTFADSEQEELLQVVDNFVSIVRHSYDKMIGHYKDKNEWEKSSSWEMMLSAKLIKRVTTKNIKFTVPMCDWAAALCTVIMFDMSYPVNMRNNRKFNFYYIQNTERIYGFIQQMRLLQRDAMEILAR